MLPHPARLLAHGAAAVGVQQRCPGLSPSDPRWVAVL